MKVNFLTGVKADLPTTAQEGSFYVTTDTGELFLFTTATNRVQLNGQWVLDQITSALNNKIVVQASPPTVTSIGMLWIDSESKMHYYDGSSWNLVAGVWT